MTFFYLILLLASGIINFVFTLTIMKELGTADKAMSFLDLRVHVLKNLKKYKEITKARYGKVGLAYFGYLATLGVLLLSVALLLNSLDSRGDRI